MKPGGTRVSTDYEDGHAVRSLFGKSRGRPSRTVAGPLVSTALVPFKQQELLHQLFVFSF